MVRKNIIKTPKFLKQDGALLGRTVECVYVYVGVMTGNP